jgi:hypothetical protein
MNSIDKILKTARAEIGNKEKPAGSNRQKYGEWYGMNGVPWCAQFVSWVFHQAGFPLPKIQDGAPSGAAYCPFVENYAKKVGQWHSRPLAGDIVLFSFGKNLAVHIGIVETVAINSFTSIEGNTSLTNNDNGGGVMRRTRNINQCRGFYRPILNSAPVNVSGYYRLIKLDSPYMQGNDIRAWQKQVNWFGYGLEVDGVFGPNCDRVARDIQKKRGLVVDGIVGPDTWRESFEPN